MAHEWDRGAMFVLLAAAAAAASEVEMPVPGQVNYLTGPAAIDGQSLATPPVGAVVGTNQVFETAQGRAEILLTPGVFLRLDAASEMRMVSANPSNVTIELTQGSAIVEADQWAPGTQLMVLMDAATIAIQKPGVYYFGASHYGIAVGAGQAAVTEGRAHLTLKTRHELILSAQPWKARKFNMDAIESDPFYFWNEQRSAYQAQANVYAAQALLAGGGVYDPGWYWDEPIDCFAFLPVGGTVYSPFGWGFYTPVTVGLGPHPIRYPNPIRKGPGTVTPAAGRAGGARAAPAHSAGGGFHGGGGGGGHGGGGGRR